MRVCMPNHHDMHFFFLAVTIMPFKMWTWAIFAALFISGPLVETKSDAESDSKTDNYILY